MSDTFGYLFVGFVLFSFILIVGCEFEESGPTARAVYFPEQDWCEIYEKELTCEQLLECYDNCDEEYNSFNKIAECREMFNPRLWMCAYDGGEE
jgi:hypothetical protein